jgi:hypothetical protein
VLQQAQAAPGANMVEDIKMEPADAHAPSVSAAVRSIETQHALALKSNAGHVPRTQHQGAWFEIPASVQGLASGGSSATGYPSHTQQRAVLEISQPVLSSTALRTQQSETLQPTSSAIPVLAPSHAIHTTAGALGAIEVTTSNAMEITSVASDSASNQSLEFLNTDLPAGAAYARPTPAGGDRAHKLLIDIQVDEDAAAAPIAAPAIPPVVSARNSVRQEAMMPISPVDLAAGSTDLAPQLTSLWSDGGIETPVTTPRDQ